MAGTRNGGLKAAQKNLERNPNFYAEIGRRGGQNSNTGGFRYQSIHEPEAHRAASRKGGKAGRRSSVETPPTDSDL